ncbi:hypothetical protein [Nocardiopsis baichengensis]|uniref:hypothetical protein n=1 Tax=Nocardiopsis baichengensis TaxID=280240 RepID=UPI00036C3A57|nr:hypothetical protein [Nocardiopsis baichengensis]
MDSPPLTAYADESFHEAPVGGFYVVAAAVLDPGGLEAAREAMLAVRGGRRVRKTHWTEMDARQRKAAAGEVADLGGLHLVTVGTPVGRARQERARAKCLNILVGELHGYGVRRLCCESRGAALDERDVKTVIAARRTLPENGRLVVEHLDGGEEPLLWAADVVAGAVRARRQGQAEYHRILEHVVYEIAVDTGC